MRNSDRVREIAERFYSGKRLSFEDGLDLYRHANLLELSQMAHWMRVRLHPEPAVTYIVSRNINYTNVCWVRCSFCAFYRPPGSEEGYVLTKEVIFQKIREMVDAGGIEILIQGGLNPRLRIEYYEDLFGSIKKNFKVHIHGLSAAEILYIAHLSRMTVKDTIAGCAPRGSIPFRAPGERFWWTRSGNRSLLSRTLPTSGWVSCGTPIVWACGPPPP